MSRNSSLIVRMSMSFTRPRLHAHAQVAEQEQRLFAGHQPGGAEQAQGAADLVVQRDGAVVQQRACGRGARSR